MSVIVINPYRFVSGGPPTLTYLTKSFSASDLTTYTFSALSFGTESATRKIAVAIYARASTTGITVSSVTVGGVSATQAAASGMDDATSSNRLDIWIATVPTGTSGDVVVTMSAAAVRCGVALYGLTNISSTPTDTAAYGVATANSDPVILSADVQANSVALAMAAWTNNTAATWVGLTEDFDEFSGETSRWTSASFTSSGAETPRTISSDPAAGAGNRIGACAVFSP